MIKTIFYLVYVFWRKYIKKGDYLTAFVIFMGLGYAVFQIYKDYNNKHYLLFIFLIATILEHIQRKDLSLLKRIRNWRIIIFGQYTLISMPILILFTIKRDFLLLLVYILGLYATTFIRNKNIKIAYPFSLYYPMWHTSFRKYKLVFIYPFLAFILYISKRYGNINLAYFVLGVISIISVVPYFEREHIIHIKSSNLKGQRFLFRQISTAFINYLLHCFIFVVLGVILFDYKILIWAVILFLITIIGVLTKYVFYGNVLSQSVFFTVMVAGSQYGLPFIAMPYIYYKAIRNIKKIQDVTH